MAGNACRSSATTQAAAEGLAVTIHEVVQPRRDSDATCSAVALAVEQAEVALAGWAVVRMLKLKGSLTVLKPSAMSF